MKKSLGGDRLGSGKKLQVDLHGFDRSTHDKGYVVRTTMAAGTLVPVINEVALNGDTFDIDLDIDVKTHPTVGPLFGSYKVQLDVFKCPIRLYIGELHNNKLKVGLDMASVKFPTMKFGIPYINAEEFTGDIDNAQINPSSILSHLGLRGFGQANPIATNKERSFNALPLLSYWDIYKNYYANKQENIGMVIHSEPIEILKNVDSVLIGSFSSTTTTALAEAPTLTPQSIGVGGKIILYKLLNNPIKTDQIFINIQGGGSLQLSLIATIVTETTTTITLRYNEAQWGTINILNWRYATGEDIVTKEIVLETFPLGNLDDMREAILGQPYINPGVTFEIMDTGYEPYIWLTTTDNDGFRSIMESQEGLAIKTYQSDMFNNWLNTADMATLNATSNVSTAGGSFSMETLIMARKVYDMQNRIAVSGGSYDDWQDAVWGMDRYSKTEIPVYVGGLSKELVFQEVVSNSQSLGADGGNQPLGTLAGKGAMSKKHKGGKITIKVDEPSVIIGLISLTPRVDYSQGNDWSFGLETMNDLHKPSLDQIGYQDLITEKMAWWGTQQDPFGTWIQTSAGKQPAWLDYMTNVNRVRGNFAIQDSEMFMTLNRKYGAFASGTWFGIEDVTTYIDPRKYNQIFAETSLDSQNFWVQIGVDMNVRRVMSAKLMPNL